MELKGIAGRDRGEQREANGTSLGSFNFTEITARLIRIKRSVVVVSSASRLEIHNNSQQRQYRTCSSKNDQFYVHYFRIHLFISPLSVPSSCMPYVEMTNFSLRI